MIVSLAVAHGKEREIGINNQLPWRLSGDLKNFKKHTMGKPVAMGRKTFESIGRILPGRENIVLTRNKNFQAPGATVKRSVSELLEYCEKKGEPELVVIGGEKIFEETLKRADILYLTEVEARIENADAFFPLYDRGQWEEVESFAHSKDENNEFPWSFKILKRKT